MKSDGIGVSVIARRRSRRSNPEFGARALDCFGALRRLAMTGWRRVNESLNPPQALTQARHSLTVADAPRAARATNHPRARKTPQGKIRVKF
jgi:hypothetical protein